MFSSLVQSGCAAEVDRVRTASSRYVDRLGGLSRMRSTSDCDVEAEDIKAALQCACAVAIFLHSAFILGHTCTCRDTCRDTCRGTCLDTWRHLPGQETGADAAVIAGQ